MHVSSLGHYKTTIEVRCNGAAPHWCICIVVWTTLRSRSESNSGTADCVGLDLQHKTTEYNSRISISNEHLHLSIFVT